jgi:hypothetical protein
MSAQQESSDRDRTRHHADGRTGIRALIKTVHWLMDGADPSSNPISLLALTHRQPRRPTPSANGGAMAGALNLVASAPKLEYEQRYALRGTTRIKWPRTHRQIPRGWLWPRGAVTVEIQRGITGAQLLNHTNRGRARTPEVTQKSTDQ